MRRNFFSASSFSLIELMIVVAIISLLVSVSILEGVKLRIQANESNAQANLRAIASAFEVYAARNNGVYAPAQVSDLQFLVAEKYLYQDLVSSGRVGNYNFVIGSASEAGYDIRAMAVNSRVAGHNYQILTGGVLKRSNTAETADAEFLNF
jgi:prepilin-type N-terminal cleavage/methylation domain-containing protein